MSTLGGLSGGLRVTMLKNEAALMELLNIG